MAANTKVRQLPRLADRILKGTPTGHYRGGSDDSVSVGLRDSAIHTQGVAEVIGINNQTPHRASLAGQNQCRRLNAWVADSTIFREVAAAANGADSDSGFVVLEEQLVAGFDAKYPPHFPRNRDLPFYL